MVQVPRSHRENFSMDNAFLSRLAWRMACMENSEKRLMKYAETDLQGREQNFTEMRELRCGDKRSQDSG
jgi:hypothetical protein